MDNLDLSKYITMALKRKWWIIIIFLISILGGMAYLLAAPRIYEAKTLIIIQGQRVPEEIVSPVVTSSVDDTLNTIYQQVTSRTNSEKIINDYGLYSSKPDILIDKKVELFTSRINIDISKDRSRRNAETTAFTISFQDEDPKKVMEVTNILARRYMDEHLKMREEEVLGTSDFISNELKTIEDQLKEKEDERKRYSEKYMGGLPEQLDTNLSILEGLREQLDQYNSNLRDAENRKTTILSDIAQERETGISSSIPSQGQRTGGMNDLASLKRQLADLQSRYTENHPDVIRTKEAIARLEKEKGEAGGSPDEELKGIGVVDQALRRQLEEVNLDISNLEGDIEDTKSQMAYYQKMVADTPKRVQELKEIDRDYDILNQQYNNYRNKQIATGISASMEKVQKGQQFKIIDYAKIPNSPIKPDKKKIILMTLALGLGLGCGIAYLLEMMDTSYKTPDEAGNDLGIPVLASIPLLVTENELKSKKRREILMGFSVAFGFVFAASGIIIGVKGFDTAMNYVKGIIGG